MTDLAKQRIPVRKLDFTFDPDMPLCFIPFDPQTSFTFVGAWMTLPYLEPYLIEVMRRGLAEITDERLREDVKRFCAQEGQHFRQHAKANDIVRKVCGKETELRVLEAELKAEYDHFLNNKPLRFSLAYGEAFEAMTAASSCAQFEIDFFQNTVGPLGTLMEWHIMEELEHRTVAFEAYEHLVGSYPYRLAMGAYGQYHFIKWGQKFAKVIAQGYADRLPQLTDEDLRKQKALRGRFLKAARPRWLQILSPRYHPGPMNLPPQFERARAHYSETAVTIS